MLPLRLNQAEVDVVVSSEESRCSECPMRLGGQCRLISSMLGWGHGVPLSDCNVCWSLGGPSSPQAEQWRADYAKKMILHHAQPHQLVLLSTPVRNAIAAHIDGGEDFYEVPPPVEEGLLGKATHFARSLRSRGLSNRKVSLPIRDVRHISCFGADPTGQRIQPPCPSLSRLEGGHFCADCGCGTGKMARLDIVEGEYSKLDFPYLWCPRGRPGFSYSEE